ncbi:hypothetical protein XENOCAPTIV_027158, partial [Xenoophorus captivus]
MLDSLVLLLKNRVKFLALLSLCLLVHHGAEGELLSKCLFFSHCLLCCALFFPGTTSSEAITLAAARQWPEIAKEPGQAASTAGSSVSGHDESPSDHATTDAADPPAAGSFPTAAPGFAPAAAGSDAAA